MKKVFFAWLTGLFFFAAPGTIQAQGSAVKIGVFDIGTMVQLLPEYRTVDSLVRSYETDSLAAEYDYYQSEFSRLDSIYKIDSAAKKAKNVLDLEKQQRNQTGLQLVYWQNIARNKTEQKRQALAQPLFVKVVTAYRTVLERNKYAVVLKPNTYEMGTPVENVFIPVAKELKVQLPPEFGGGQQEMDATPASRPAASGKPAVKK